MKLAYAIYIHKIPQYNINSKIQFIVTVRTYFLNIEISNFTALFVQIWINSIRKLS